MTDLDSTEILSADESLVQNNSIVETVSEEKDDERFSPTCILRFQEATLKVISGTDPHTHHINSTSSDQFLRRCTFVRLSF